jgi:hypothetical protein
MFGSFNNSPFLCSMENGQTKITFKIEKNKWGFYTTTLYQNGKVMGYVDTDNKTQAVKTTSSQKKLQEHINICQIFS